MKFLISFLLVFVVSSCSQKPSQVINRSKNVYSKNNSTSKEKNRASKQKSATVASSKSKNHQVEVGSGDTVYSVSKKYQVTVHDLIKQNDLNPPYNLRPGAKLAIPSPNYYEVKSGDTLYGISRAHNMKIDNLIEMNDLKAPYSVKVGQKLRIAKFENKASVAETEKKPLQKAQKKDFHLANSEKKPEPGFIEKTLDKLNHFSWPLRGTVVSKFGPKPGGLYNDGINIKAREGAEVKAAEDGVIAYVGNELKGYGNLVIIKHSGGWITAYAHLEKFAVKRGQKISKGGVIGTVGTTGNVHSPQLYFGLRKGRDAVNPENYLR